MHTVQFSNLACVELQNESLRLLVTQSVGLRILSLQYRGSANLLADLPDFSFDRPDGQIYHLRGGHRLWHSPEHMPRTYAIDDQPVEIEESANGLLVKQPVEAETGIEKAMQIQLAGSQVSITHSLTNRGLWPVTLAPWAITMLRAGGVAILPQNTGDTGLLPNRSLVLWPYADMTVPQVTWGRETILIRSPLDGPFKLGFGNRRGWMAYWIDGLLFVKRAEYLEGASYPDDGSSSECYANQQFLELETLGPLATIGTGQTVSHVEYWQVFPEIVRPETESHALAIAGQLGLG